ncbi:hypothetical protein OIU77_027481 [Salix suchowensis]|uniref:Beta-amylase n=1 Tax=Salix suchowensis TaxID=1278906 RepID=A0ABQ9BPT0_9ROSI|nr:hypothetical protein OIU77_027481 [Salix suchowensis]
MTITLQSSASFISLKEIRSLKTPHDGFSGTVRFAQIEPSCRLQAKINSEQEAQLSHDDVLVAEGRASQTWEKLHAISSPHGGDAGSRVPVFVMLPLDTVTIGGSLNKPKAMNASLMALRSAGVEGVMVDAWWGIGRERRAFQIQLGRVCGAGADGAEAWPEASGCYVVSSVWRKCWRFLQHSPASVGA